jgi:type IV secretory pathway TraG/TraD family ATPase VirD4
LSVLLDAIFKRSAPPAATTLLMVDEAGTIGPVPQIETAFTLSRGYGCRITAVFQSMHQLETSYSLGARTVFDNAGTISILPPSNPRCAREQADVLGITVDDLLSMGADEVLVARRGQAPRVLRRPDCLSDTLYRGRCDAAHTPGARR